MSRQIVITLPEWTEIKGINNKQFREIACLIQDFLREDMK